MTSKARVEFDPQWMGVRAAVLDLCWKATPFGETEDGDTYAYIIPKGAVHRLIGAAQSAGIPAAFREPVRPTTEGGQR